jgi:hypothetical protein
MLPGALGARCRLSYVILGRRLVKFTFVYGIQVVLAGGLGFALALTLAVGVEVVERLPIAGRFGVKVITPNGQKWRLREGCIARAGMQT